MMNTQDIIKKYIPKNTQTEISGNVISYKISPDEIVEICKILYEYHKLPLKIISASDDRKESKAFKIMYVFGIPKENIFLVPYILVQNDFPSLTPYIHEASNYERKIKTFFGLTPKNHPSLRSVILHENWPDNKYPLRKDFAWNSRPNKASGEFHFRKMSGEGIYEIPVGPVHAGIIEPGHFRFSVAGEEILMLEPRLGYSHKGSEKLFETLPLEDKVRLAERISGDSSFNHALAFCLALENLGEVKVSEKVNYLRVIFAELERLANHFGDIGAIMIDTSYNFGGSNGARLREMVMQANESLSGSRFLRGLMKIGGINTDISDENVSELNALLNKLEKDFSEVIGIALNCGTLLNRLRKTGTLNPKIAKDHGVVGIAGKALGFEMDARVDYPYAIYEKMDIKVALEEKGDVHARFQIRIKEVYSSIEILRKALEDLSKSEVNENQKTPTFKKNSMAVGITEGWRGDIVYLVLTDSKGEIDRVDVRDPSFLNWTALAHTGVGNMVPDFPLINKSFNLSYSGNDL